MSAHKFKQFNEICPDNNSISKRYELLLQNVKTGEKRGSSKFSNKLMPSTLFFLLWTTNQTFLVLGKVFHPIKTHRNQNRTSQNQADFYKINYRHDL